jgi:hypothetical protein
MRTASLIISSVLLTGLVTGCKSPEAQAAVQDSGTAASSAALEPMTADRKDAKEAAKVMRDYAYAQKSEFVVEMNRELAAIQVELDRLAVKADEATGTAKDEAKTALEKVRVQWALAKKELVEAEKAPEHTWSDVKVGFKKAYGDLKDSVTKSRHWLSKKIEP